MEEILIIRNQNKIEARWFDNKSKSMSVEIETKSKEKFPIVIVNKAIYKLIKKIKKCS